MKRAFLPTAILVFACVLPGCSGNQEDETTVKPPAGVVVNNNAPEAKNAPFAPGPNSTVPRPGGGATAIGAAKGGTAKGAPIKPAPAGP